MLFAITVMSNTFCQVDESFKFRIIDPNGFYDETILRINDNATTNWDPAWDAWKIFSPSTSVPSIYSKSAEGYDMAINSFNRMQKDSIINLFVRARETSGQYTIETEQLGAFPDNIKLALKDDETGTIVSLSQNTSYSFQLNADSINDFTRFHIYYSPKPIIDINDNDLTICNNGCFNWEYTIVDSNNTIIENDFVYDDTVIIQGLENGQFDLIVTDEYNLSDTIHFEINSTDSTDNTAGQYDENHEFEDYQLNHFVYQYLGKTFLNLDNRITQYNSIQIYDLGGRVIESIDKPNSYSPVSLSCGNAGQVYFIEIKSEESYSRLTFIQR